MDVATGNGQAAQALAEHAGQVIAIDASFRQVRQASSHDGVYFACGRSEEPPVRGGSMDLVTVAQAIHWFDFDRFFAACDRICATGGIVAAWTYDLLTVTPAVDAIVRTLYEGPVGEHWPAERRHVESRYETVPFPLGHVPAPVFTMRSDWTVEQLLGYLRTWSAVRRFVGAGGPDPISAIDEQLRAAFGPGTRVVHWPFTLKVGRVDSSG